MKKNNNKKIFAKNYKAIDQEKYSKIFLDLAAHNLYCKQKFFNKKINLFLHDKLERIIIETVPIKGLLAWARRVYLAVNSSHPLTITKRYLETAKCKNIKTNNHWLLKSVCLQEKFGLVNNFFTEVALISYFREIFMMSRILMSSRSYQDEYVCSHISGRVFSKGLGVSSAMLDASRVCGVSIKGSFKGVAGVL
jgi:hypothetical protein